MYHLALPITLALSLALLVGCGSPQATAPPPAVSASTEVPQSTATAVPVSAATAVQQMTATTGPRPTATVAPISTSTPGPVPSASAAKPMTPAGSPVAGQGTDWKLYRDDSQGFEFNYPTACTVAQQDGSLTVGGRIDLAITDAGGVSLRDYVTRFVDERTRTSGWKVDSQQTVTLGANQGIRVDYRFGGTSRFGTAIFFDKQGRVYTWGLTAGSFACNEPAAFDGIVSSFRSAR